MNAEDKLFYCFGCQAKGDAIGFVEQTDGLDFREAVELLAERYGVKLEREDEDPEEERRRRRRERLYSLLERATRFYAAYLWDSAEAGEARAYLSERGLKEEMLREFGVGYSPSAWDRMLVAARSDGFTGRSCWPRDSLQRRAQRRSLRPLSRPHHVPAGRRPRPRAGLRRAADGGGARAEVPEHLRERDLPQGPAALRHRHRALRGAKSARIVVVRVTPTCSPCTRLGFARPWRSWVPRSRTTSWPRWGNPCHTGPRTAIQARFTSPSTPTVQGRRRCRRSRAAPRTAGLDLRVVEMPEGTDPADLLVISDGSDAFEVALDSAVGMPVSGRTGTCRCRPDTPAGRDRGTEEARS